MDYHKNLKNYHSAKLNLIKKHKSKNSFLFLQDYSLKSKFRSFKSKLSLIILFWATSSLVADEKINIWKDKNNSKNEKIYIYGKTETKKGRKMGHVNFLEEFK